MKSIGHNVLDVTPSDSYNTSISDLSYGINKANSWDADLFISCHFNNAYTSYNGALGSEVLVYDSSFKEANSAMAALASLGFKNRGVKARPTLYELRNTTMPAMIIETCFVEATEDVALYKKLGPDLISKTIAEYISEKNVPSTPDNNTPDTSNKELWEVSISGEIVKELQRELNIQANANLVVDGYFGTETLNKCIIVMEGASGNLTKIIQKRLIALNYSVGSYGADGIFGASTKNAILKFQKDRKLTSDGIVGKTTWKELFKK